MIDGLSPPVREMLERSGALLRGHFILSSGLHSELYLQCAKLCAVPEFCEALARQLAEKIRAALGPKPCDLTLAPALGGVVIGYELGRQLGVPALFAEREKGGAMTLRRGFELKPGERALLVEDVITTGGSVLEVAQIVNRSGAIVSGYGTIFDRSAGRFAPVEPVFSIDRVTVAAYEPAKCPLCAEGKLPAVKPGSRIK